MNENYDKLEQLLHERLADHSVDVPSNGWDRIAASMAEIDAAAEKPIEPVAPIRISTHRHKRLGMRRTWQYGIAAMLLLGIGLLANRLTHLAPQPDQSKLLASTTVLYDPATTSNEATIEEPASTDPIKDIANTQTRFATRSESKTSSKNAQNENATLTSDINEFDYSTEKAADVEPVESTNNHVSVESSASNDNHKQSNQKTDDTHTAREQFQKRLQEVLKGDKRRSGRFSTALYASNLNGVGGNFDVSSNRLAQSGMVATEVLNISQGEVISIMGTGESVRVQPETKMKHHVPFTVGASLQYELTDRWAIESGVTYTYLHSTAKAEGIFTYEWSQELHYIGIPLTASYKIINRNMFDLYARAGGAVERAVAANKVFNMSAGTSEGISRPNEKIDCKGVQMSVAAAIGAEVKLINRLGIYAEAGAGYFFDNNQPLSYRSENPFSVTLQAGLRLHLGNK